ncbi:hypothetical protein ACHQM5_023096 [Ranunculus cassubicifolius]
MGFFMGVVLPLTSMMAACILLFILDLKINRSRYVGSASDLLPILALGFMCGLAGAFSIIPALDYRNKSEVIFAVLFFAFCLHLGASRRKLCQDHNIWKQMIHNSAHKGNERLKQQEDTYDADHQPKLKVLRDIVAQYEEKHKMLKQQEATYVADYQPKLKY